MYSLLLRQIVHILGPNSLPSFFRPSLESNWTFWTKLQSSGNCRDRRFGFLTWKGKFWTSIDSVRYSELLSFYFSHAGDIKISDNRSLTLIKLQQSVLQFRVVLSSCEGLYTYIYTFLAGWCVMYMRACLHVEKNPVIVTYFRLYRLRAALRRCVKRRDGQKCQAEWATHQEEALVRCCAPTMRGSSIRMSSSSLGQRSLWVAISLIEIKTDKMRQRVCSVFSHISRIYACKNQFFFFFYKSFLVIRGFTTDTFKSFFFFLKGIQRLYEEGDDPEELDEGVGEDTMEEEQDEEEEEEEKEKDVELDDMQSKSHLLPERRSRRLKSEVSHIFYGHHRLQNIHLCAFFFYTQCYLFWEFRSPLLTLSHPVLHSGCIFSRGKTRSPKA